MMKSAAKSDMTTPWFVLLLENQTVGLFKRSIFQSRQCRACRHLSFCLTVAKVLDRCRLSAKKYHTERNDGFMPSGSSDVVCRSGTGSYQSKNCRRTNPCTFTNNTGFNCDAMRMTEHRNHRPIFVARRPKIQKKNRSIISSIASSLLLCGSNQRQFNKVADR